MARLIDPIFDHEAVWKQLCHLYETDRLPQALAFTGPSGIGKRRIAWAFAQALLCERTRDRGIGNGPCGECGSCLRVEHGQSESVLRVEPQGTQIKIESAHQVLEFLALAKLAAVRMVIINEAQLLNAQTANALLKIVEEPPPSTYFIFVVPEISQLLPTLRSRCQVLRFSPLSEETLQRVAGLESSKGAALKNWMVRSARGSFERLAEFQDEEMDQLRQQIFAFLQISFQGGRDGLEQLLGVVKDRQTALHAIHFLQQGLRDWVFLGTGQEIHIDHKFELSALPNLEPRLKVSLWRWAQQMENDLFANVDRTLLFENFFFKVRGFQNANVD